MFVIFDCDGVLVDSELLGAEVFSQVLAEFGVDLSADDCFSMFKGLTLEACYQAVKPLFNQEVPDQLHDRVVEVTKHVFSRDLKPIGGIEEVIKWLYECQIPFCVASNGALKKREIRLKQQNYMIISVKIYFLLNRLSRASPRQIYFFMLQSK